MKTYGIDTETYYDRSCTVEELGVRSYVRHPSFYVGVVAVYGEDYQFSGKPEDVDWDRLAGHTWVSHNAKFDMLVIETLTSVKPQKWYDSSAIPAYLQVRRSLDNASKYLLGRELDKGARLMLKGKHYHKLDAVRWQRAVDYCLADAQACYDLYVKFAAHLPEWEWTLADLTITQTMRGIRINEDYLTESIASLESVVNELQNQVPWRHERKVFSIDAFRAHCKALGVSPPKTTEQKSPEWLQWVDANSHLDWVVAWTDLRKANRTWQDVQKIKARVQPNGRCDFDIKYCGARATGRWAADNALNMLNLNKKESFGVNIRHLFVAGHGNVLLTADLSQIEPRCLRWSVQDTAWLDMVKSGMDVYEAHARASMGYTDPRPLAEVNPGMRQEAKVRELGLGYGMWASGFQAYCHSYGLTISEAKAKTIVKQYRSQNQKITGMWRSFDANLAQAAATDGELEVDLPSGRTLRYRNIKAHPGKYSTRYEAVVEQGSLKPFWCWGSLLTENYTQAMARDVFATWMLRIEDAGIPILFHVYDEFTAEVSAGIADQAIQFILDCLQDPIDWAPGLPLNAKVIQADKYEK